MHTKLTLGERLKDLRIERGYTLRNWQLKRACQKRPLASMRQMNQGT